MIIYSSFDEFWAVNYEGQFGQGVVAEVFKEVAEKAWVEATLYANGCSYGESTFFPLAYEPRSDIYSRPDF